MRMVIRRKVAGGWPDGVDSTSIAWLLGGLYCLLEGNPSRNVLKCYLSVRVLAFHGKWTSSSACIFLLPPDLSKPRDVMLIPHKRLNSANNAPQNGPEENTLDRWEALVTLCATLSLRACSRKMMKSGKYESPTTWYDDGNRGRN